jgi:hypothetical protein
LDGLLAQVHTRCTDRATRDAARQHLATRIVIPFGEAGLAL